MAASKLCIPLLVSSLVVAVACGGGSNASHFNAKHPEKKSDTVKISQCDADPDMVDVSDGQTLTWKVDNTDPVTYTISFASSSPVPSAVSHASSSSPNAQVIHKTLGCSLWGWISDDSCKYYYSLQNGPSTVCPDPGVHIIPPG